MRPESRAYLWDARRSADAVMQYTRGRTFDDYVSNDMLRSAVERRLQGIGAALAPLARSDPATAERVPRLHEIIAFGDVLVRDYALLENAVVWRVVEEDLPTLHADLTRLLDEG